MSRIPAFDWHAAPAHPPLGANEIPSPRSPLELRRFADRIRWRVRSYSVTNALVFAFARFRTCRALVKLARRAYCPMRLREEEGGVVASPARGEVVERLRQDSWCPGFVLPEATVNEIVSQVKRAQCMCDALPGQPQFRLGELEDIERELGREIALVDCVSPTKIPGVVDIGNDPRLLNIVNLFLGREPKRIEFRLMVSLARSLSTRERMKQHQTVLFHYDLDDFQTLFINFYLTDCDAGSGAHVLIEGTHANKKLRQLLRTTNHTDEELARYHPPHSHTVVSGPAGFGFAEDTYCFHKALAPEKRERYMLQIRYV